MHMTTEIRLVPIAELVPYAGNARTHSDEQVAQLRASLREFGFVVPILIDGANNVIAGHGRLLAARAEGLETVPCVLADYLTDAQRRAYCLADNKLAEMADWDEDVVRSELTQLREAGFDIALTGFGEDDLALDEPDPEAADDDYEIKLPAETKTKPGDLYILGDHRLLCGDATKQSDVERLMRGESADLLLTDPPYNVGIQGGTAEKLTIENDNWASDEDFQRFLSAAFSVARGAMKPGASFYIFHSDAAPALQFRAACACSGLLVRQCLIWCKQQATLGRQDYQWQHEPCLAGDIPEPEPAEHESALYGWKDGAAHSWNSDRKQTTVLFFDKPARNADHPTIKPVPLIGYLMHNSSVKGQSALDTFAGSGTTLIAAEQLGRHAYLIEHDPRYCDVIVDRWEKFTGKKAVLSDE